MVKEAEQFAEQDKKRKEEAEIRNQADTLIYTAERTKTDLKDRIPADLGSKLDAAIKELKDALAGQDTELIKQKSEGLSTVLKDVGTMAYQQAAASSASGTSSSAGGQGTSSQSSGGPSEGPNVVDAEYKVNQDNESAKGPG
jgi:molecular chaperone DnaK